jgi:pyruvate carboxylase
MTVRPFQKILVANRGEIAIRVFRAATELGLRTVAIFSEEDKFSLHRYKADEAYQVGKGLGPVRAYLAIDEIVNVAKRHSVDAIHPGYGFLAENAEFADACRSSGITFIGPTPELIAMMGDKVAARRAAQKLDLPMVPGTPGAVSMEGAVEFARKHGFPVMLKSAFGGGGRGMRVARNAHELKVLFADAERESKTAFGRAEIFVEKLVDRPKHIEVQILGDGSGNVIHCFERDCSVQRRHQKVIELAPAPSLRGHEDGEVSRRRVCEMAARLARETGYTNAGTVEFLYEPETDRFYFMEMNTRIQVEHTVTEMVTGIDIVKTQIRIAEGYRLDDAEIGLPSQEVVECRGVAIQCRITTEDPAANFLPDYGRLTVYRSSAGHGIRLDAGTAHTGAIITPYYDSLLVKISALGRDLHEAARRMDRALAEFRVRGVKTNIAFLRAVMSEREFLSGDARTDYLERHPETMINPEAQDRASKLLQYIADVTVNGNPMIKGEKRPKRLANPQPPPAPEPPEDGTAPFSSGTRQILEKRGVEGLQKWILSQKGLLITDTTFRDAHQSLLATRVRTYDMLAVAGGMIRREPGVFSYEVWGGATFDTAARFLKEDPWGRLAVLREAMPNALLQMLLRGSNAVGYTNYPDNAIREFVRMAAETGVDVFRIFDSLNVTENMHVAIDAVRHAGKIAEPAICYTGNIEDPKRAKYSLKYYVKLAKELERAGGQILAIKDMAGLLRPFSARILVKALKEEVGIPIHLHTHDTAGIQAATLLNAAEAGVDIVDAALSSMSGLTSQVNLNGLVAALEHHRRSTGLDLSTLNEYAVYWEDARRIYAPFESELRSGTADVYVHEMPGGQYTNLRAQAEAMNLGRRWPDVVRAYSAANRLFGDIVKVTPSSKVVGDMALFMVANNVTEENFFERAKTLSFPESVIGMMKGNLGRAPGGFPKKVQEAILKGAKPLRSRPGGSLPKIDFAKVRSELEKKAGQRKADPSSHISDFDVMSYVMYPAVTLEYLEHRKAFGDTSILPTPIFFFGMQPGEETQLEIERGKTLYIKLIAIAEPDIEGFRTIFFELNGHPRDVKVADHRTEATTTKRPKADPDNLHQLGAPMPGRVVQALVKEGQEVQKGDALFVLEAMKMETSVTAPQTGVVGDVHVSAGDSVDAGDLIMAYR